MNPEPPKSRQIGLLLFLVVLVCVIGPRLLYSSTGYRVPPLLCGCLIAACFTWPCLTARFTGRAAIILTLGAGLLLAHAASLAGAILSGGDGTMAVGMALAGMVGVLGLAVLVAVLAEPPWHRWLGWTGLAFLAHILIGSYAGYLFSIERHIPLGGHAEYFDSFRIALIWPSRLLMAGKGQLAWENTVYAGFYFALAAVLVLELFGKGKTRRAWPWWTLVAVLISTVFLTGSRGAWLMVAASLPFLLLRRPWQFRIKTLLVFVVGIALGAVSLGLKISVTETTRERPGERHLDGLVTRGSSGRLEGYQQLWEELEGRRMTGRGLAATGKPVGDLLHEHSSILATMRGGGLLALFGHGLVLAAAAWGAFLQLVHGRRWPAILLMAVLAFITFDRSNVFRLTGNIEFIAHWVAVLAAVVLVPPASLDSDTASGPSVSRRKRGMERESGAG